MPAGSGVSRPIKDTRAPTIDLVIGYKQGEHIPDPEALPFKTGRLNRSRVKKLAIVPM